MDLLPNSSDTGETDTPKVCVPGVHLLLSAGEAALDEEWMYSTMPFPTKSFDESDQDVNSPSVSSDDGHADDFRDFADFEEKVEATFLQALTGAEQDYVIMVINSLWLSYNKSIADCAVALFSAIMKSAYDCAHSSSRELLPVTTNAINKWNGLLKNYLKTKDEEIAVIMKFEDMCSGSMREFSTKFTTILNRLYENDILSRAAILTWAKKREGADEAEKVFMKQAEPFIMWLKVVPKDEEEDGGWTVVSPGNKELKHKDNRYSCLPVFNPDSRVCHALHRLMG